ncbi:MULTISPECIES: glycosyltransferase family 1 protein [unclassified Brevundimonas]|uniref:glycosyltransferase family 4 protein n=1 Tax=unclassified Brevundimonas TaxID=2622653 RepID=UPI0020054475|nr:MULTISPECIES: glycosyltransferase family 1 protein [unclassified Brevundimonas]MCK6104967.1 glycosyltransferase family 4 protein [Brevundimonas sp. EYE_349]MCW0046906.1 glycosyltransferase family 4 protein [Brevundimonas sp. BT-123]
MRTVCIDGHNLALPNGTGIATYGRNLLTSLSSLGINGQVLYGPPNTISTDNVLNEVVLADSLNTSAKVRKSRRYIDTISTRFGRKAIPVLPSGEVIWPSRSGGRPDAKTFWAAQNLFHYAQRGLQVYGTATPVTFDGAPKPDIMHWTATLPLHATNALNVYTIHDLIPLRLPHSTTENKSVYRRLCNYIAKKADHIVVVSETTRQDVIRLLGVPEERVTNTYQAVTIPLALRSRAETEVALELEGVFGLGWKDYFLYFGAIEPKKNVGRIIEAYLSSGVKKPLIIVGGRAWLAEGETALLEQVKRDGGPSADRIRRYEYMSYSMLLSLIRGARATIFPSLYEGFGLPVLESMLLNTAVLTSTAGSLPEIAGGAALTVDPYDVGAITKGIQSLDIDDGLAESLVARGKIQAGKFSAEEYEERLRLLYDNLQ